MISARLGPRQSPKTWICRGSCVQKKVGDPPWALKDTLLGTNISPEKSILKMIFLFRRWDMLISWRVSSSKRYPDDIWDDISGILFFEVPRFASFKCFRPGKLEKRDVLQQFCTCKKVNLG